MKSTNTLGVVITDGVGFRNFILSSFLSEALEGFDRVIVYSGLPNSIYQGLIPERVLVYELPVFVEPPMTWFWRKYKEVAHLQLHKRFFGINDNWKANKSSSSSIKGKAIRGIYRLTNLSASESIIRRLEKFHFNSLKGHQVSKACLKILQDSGPDLLFFTHQRPPYVVPLAVAAHKLKIPFGSFIFSWDNLASKGRMATSFKFHLVWSELMSSELKYFYPNADGSKIAVVGTPQFEPYVMTRYSSDLSQFQERFSLESDKKTICYSCGDISTSRNDELYIETIATAIENGKITEPVNLLVRTSPAEEPDRFFSLKNRFHFIKWNFPEWKIAREAHPEAWSQRVPTPNDITVLREILEFSDMSINMCSTMSLDFMLFDKPVINPVFGNEENCLYNDQRFLRYGHYEKVVESGAVRVALNAEELINSINFYLANPSADSVERKALIKQQVGKPLEGTSKRITEALKNIS